MREAEKVNFEDLSDSEVSFGELPGGLFMLTNTII